MTEKIDLLIRADAAGITTLTLNRPAARNALSMELMAALIAELTDIDANPAIRAVVIAAEGPAFCAGHDLREIRATPDKVAYEALFARCSELMLGITRLTKPVIARIQGPASAAGCQLVATCDLAVAADTAMFATPGVNIGLFCSTPMVAISRNVGRKQTMEMLLTGEMMDAPTACAAGLINAVAPAAELDAQIQTWCTAIASKSALTLKIGKEAFYRQLDMPLEDAYRYASEVMVRNMQTRDAEEGIDAFLEKRPPTWTGE